MITKIKELAGRIVQFQQSHIIICVISLLLVCVLSGCHIISSSGKIPNESYTPETQNDPISEIKSPTIPSTRAITQEILETPFSTVTATNESNPYQVIALNNIERLRFIYEWELLEFPEMAWSPDSSEIILALDGGIFVLDIDTFKQRLYREPSANGEVVYDFAYTSDGNSIVAIVGNSIQRWETQAGNVIDEFTSNECNTGYAVAINPDGNTISTGWWNTKSAPLNTSVSLWDLSTCECWKTYQPIDGSLRSLTFSPDGNMLAIGLGATNNQVQLRNIENNNLVCTLDGHFSSFSIDGNILATWDSIRVYLWDTNGCESIGKSQDFSDAYYMSFNSVNHLFAIAEVDQSESSTASYSLRMIDINSGDDIIGYRGENGWISYLEFSPDGCFLVAVVSNYNESGQIEYHLALFAIK